MKEYKITREFLKDVYINRIRNIDHYVNAEIFANVFIAYLELKMAEEEDGISGDGK